MRTQRDFYKFENLKKLEVKDFINLSVSILGIILSNLQMAQIKNLNVNDELEFVIYDTIICLVIILTNIYCFINRRKVITNGFTIEKLEEKNKNLIEVNDNVRCFKHDFNNIIQAIDGYIILDDMNSLQNYFKSLLKECNYVNVVDFLNYKTLNNPAIYGVLLNKYKIAEENGIKMNIDILVDISSFDNKSYIISRMLGILLDNALEATNECEDKVVNVQFLKEEEKKRVSIIIENTYHDKDIDTDKIFEKNFTTKKEMGNSGLGLWKIRDILRKDTDLDLYTTKDDIMFKQQLEIYG